MSRINMAIDYAVIHYKNLKRKYTGMPYVTHPLAVASIIESITDDENMYIAALFHDLVEDTVLTNEDIWYAWGVEVAGLVFWLTDKSKKTDGNRSVRKAIDREHLSQAPVNAKTIKLADLIHNTGSIVKYDAKFAKIYMKEKALLLEVLKDGDPVLWYRANDIVKNYFNQSCVVNINE